MMRFYFIKLKFSEPFFNNCEVFMCLNFLVSNFVLLISIADSFPHEFLT